MNKLSALFDEAMRLTFWPMRIEATLNSFKASVDAYEVAAFDGWRSEKLFYRNATAPAALWDAVGKLDCFKGTVWSPFKSRLVREGESEIGCHCGAHFVTAFLIRYRWSLIVLGRQSLIAPLPELLPVRTKTMETLARILPELDKGSTADPPPGDPRAGGGGGDGPAELGIPVRWARGRN